MSNTDIRWQQRLGNYQKALQQLKAAIALSKERPLSDLERQGLVQAFEFTHELAWKTMKDFIESKGNEPIYGSKDATREAFSLGILKDGQGWMNMIESRNLTSHTYNLDTVQQIAESITEEYGSLFELFEKNMLERF